MLARCPDIDGLTIVCHCLLLVLLSRGTDADCMFVETGVRPVGISVAIASSNYHRDACVPASADVVLHGGAVRKAEGHVDYCAFVAGLCAPFGVVLANTPEGVGDCLGGDSEVAAHFDGVKGWFLRNAELCATYDARNGCAMSNPIHEGPVPRFIDLVDHTVLEDGFVLAREALDTAVNDVDIDVLAAVLEVVVCTVRWVLLD